MVEKKYHRKIYQKKLRRFSSILKFFGFSFLFFAFCFLVLFLYYAKDLPRPEVFAERQLAQSTRIYDRSGQVLLYEIYGEEKRAWVPLEKMPDYLRQAVLVAEDANFYHHFGIDFRGIARAMLRNLRIRRLVHGGSTIPQQLIRSTFLSPEKTVERKIREIILSLELDRRYSKDQILEWYLNQVPFGQNAYGVEAASQTYFRRSVENISLAEAAILASLIRAPYGLSPYYEERREGLLRRKDHILDRMVKEEYLTGEVAEMAKKEEIKFAPRRIELRAPYFTLWVKQVLEEKYGQDFLQRRGLRVFTTLDWELQQIAQDVVKRGVERNKRANAHNAALVAIDPKTGEILALTVGTGDYYAKAYPEGCVPGLNCQFDPKFNIVIGTRRSPGRQPGSAFKPIVYAAAFEKGYNDKTIVADLPTNFGIWAGQEYLPQNYDQFFRGEITLRGALAQSLNISSTKVLYLIGSEEKFERLKINDFKGREKILSRGVEKSLELAREMGITTLNKPLSYYGPALVLGGGEVKLLELTSAYGIFATEGLMVPPISILRIEDSAGNLIQENEKTPKRVLNKEVCRLMNDILSDNQARAPMFGWASPLHFPDYQVAVKTGTTQNYRDAWTVGYTPSIVVGVWVGNNDNSAMIKRPGVMFATPIFHSFLRQVLAR